MKRSNRSRTAVFPGALGAFFCAILFWLASCAHSPSARPAPEVGHLPSVVSYRSSDGWGVDACLTRHVDDDEFSRYLDLLRSSGVRVLRERDVGSRKPDGNYDRDVRSKFRAEKAAGFQVVAFASPVNRPKVEQTASALPENLLEVFEGGKLLAQDFSGLVDAWEMVGEPDVGYCMDLPDRLVAYQKALYLGIKAGAAESHSDSPVKSGRVNGETGEAESSRLAASDPSTLNAQHTAAPAPLVLMGALALPPGPWLERATRNGLLDYTDAYNFHFYGNAEDLTGVIAAHGRATQRVSVDRKRRTGGSPSSIFSPLSSAYHRLTSVLGPPSSGLPLWITECGINAVPVDDFLNPARRQKQAAFTLSTAKQALAARDVAVFMPFILVHENDPHTMTLSASQPLPAWDAYAEFTRAHPWPNRPLAARPESPNPIVLQWMPAVGAAVPHKVSGTYRFWQRQPMYGEIRIYNFSSQPVQGRLRSVVPDVFRDLKSSTPAAEIAVPAGGRAVVPVTFSCPGSGYARGDCEFVLTDSTGRESRASFGLETWPELPDFIETTLPLEPLAGRQIRFPEFADYQPGETGGPWQTINGLHVAAAGGGEHGDIFWTDRPSLDPLRPAMAFAAIKGVPAEGFLRVQLDQPMGPGHSVRVDLVDEDGQRFCIWENYGQSYFVKASDVWLNVRDMQIYFWGHCKPDPTFHPGRVKEIQLWFYRKTPGERMRVQLSWMTPRTLPARP